MRSEYDFSKGVRGRYAKRFRQGTNVVVLSPDVSQAFPNSKSVNEALRNLLKAAKKNGSHNKSLQRTRAGSTNGKAKRRGSRR